MAVKDRSTSFPVRSYSTFNWDGDASPAPWDRTQTRTNTRVRDGVACPNWKSIIRAGGDATTALTATYDTIHHSYGFGYAKYRYNANPLIHKWQEWNGGALALNNGQLDRYAIDPSMSTTFAENGARAKWYKKLRAESTAFSTPIFLGELKETLHMLRRPAVSLFKSASAYMDALKKNARKSGGFKKGTSGRRALTKTAGGLWLEYSFGWVPLLHDIEDAISAYEQVWQRPSETKKISAGFRCTYDRSRERAQTYGADMPGATTKIAGSQYYRYTLQSMKLYEIHDIRYRGAVHHQVKRPQWDRASELFGFKPLEFIPTAWELLPWSFLADYFTNIGDILTSVATDTTNVSYVSYSKRLFTQYSGRIVGNRSATQAAIGSNFSIDSFTEGSSDWLINRKKLYRSKSGGVPLPTLQLSWDLNNGQLGNIAALLTNAISLHPQRFRR